MSIYQPADDVQRWTEQQAFENDLRDMMRVMRPNVKERLLGWNEYRAGGDGFCVTISWNEQFQQRDEENQLLVPRIADVLEAALVGSAKNQDQLEIHEECRLYRAVVEQLHQRINELEDSYG